MSSSMVAFITRCYNMKQVMSMTLTISNKHVNMSAERGEVEFVLIRLQ